MTITANLTFDLGETWIIDHTSCNTDGLTPIDITGGSVGFYVKGTAAAVLTPSQATSTITDGPNGKATIKVTPAQQTAAGVTAQVASYVIRTTLADGTVTDQNIGTLTIRTTAAN